MRSKNDEAKEMFQAGMEEQCKDMSPFITNFNWVQEQELNTDPGYKRTFALGEPPLI